ncbi:MAG: BtpA/SgcQ family protein [Puniceicoccaceae bacterium]
MSLVEPANSFPRKSLIAMIGLRPLPGSPGYGGSIQAIIDRAMEDLRQYKAAGADAVLLENSGDLPYIKPPLADEACQLVEQICSLVRMECAEPVGLQLLEAANLQAMQIAAACKLEFIRAEGYVFAHIGGAGLIEGCAGTLLRERKRLRADHVRVFADVRKKHCSHALTGDLPLGEHVRQADFFHADGIIITGPRTGAEPDIEDLQEARSACRLPLLIGSGLDPDNLDRFFPHADGFIVGSTFRRKGAFLEDLCPDRLNRFMDAFQRLKSQPADG